MRSRDTVTTLGTRAWRQAATAAASSMYFRMAPPCTLPYTLASSGVMSLDIVVADWLIGTGGGVDSLGTLGQAGGGFRTLPLALTFGLGTGERFHTTTV